jgi:hypothetical protein
MSVGNGDCSASSAAATIGAAASGWRPCGPTSQRLGATSIQVSSVLGFTSAASRRSAGMVVTPRSRAVVL